MDRKEFLSTLGLGLTFGCAAGCLASCSKEGGGPANPPGPPPSSGQGFTVDLNSELRSVGESLVRSGVIVVRLTAGNTAADFTAVQVACTHQGTAVNFNSSEGRFICPNHGSKFTVSGMVLNGPATSDLRRYQIAVAGSTLTVS